MFLALALTLLGSPPAGIEHQTTHYDLYAEGVNEADTGAMLEELYRQLTKHFGAAPQGRLRVEVYATQEGWQEGLKRDGLGDPKSGGYYDPGGKKAYLWVQPSEYFTRQLILHEATHQFHYLAATGNRNPNVGWYTEGLAEYFGMHNWDGKELKTGVVPAVTLEDYPAQALAQFDRLKHDLQGVADGSTACDRPLGWALVHYLMNRDPKRFHELAARLDAQRKPEKAWNQVFGPVSAATVKDFREYLTGNAQPWRIATVSWQERGSRIEGKAAVTSVVLLKKMPAALEAEVEILDGSLKAGIAFNFKSNDAFTLLQVLPDNKARIVQLANGGWKVLATADVPAADGNPVVSWKREGKEAVLAVNGQEVGRLPDDGEVGLNVEGCQAVFRVRK